MAGIIRIIGLKDNEFAILGKVPDKKIARKGKLNTEQKHILFVDKSKKQYFEVYLPNKDEKTASPGQLSKLFKSAPSAPYAPSNLNQRVPPLPPPLFPQFSVYPGQYRYDVPAVPEFHPYHKVADSGENVNYIMPDIPITDTLTINDIKFQFSRLNPAIEFLKTVPLNNKAKAVLFNNIQAVVATLLSSNSISSIINQAKELIEDFANFLDIENKRLLNKFLSAVSERPNDFIRDLPLLINTILDKINTTYNRATSVSDFNFNELFAIYSNYDLSKIPPLKTFFDEEKNTLPLSEVTALDNAQNYAKSLPQINALEQIIIYLIQKYGLNFPPAIKQFMITQIIKLNTPAIKTTLRLRLSETPYDSVSINLAKQLFGSGFIQDAGTPPEKLYDQDIKTYGDTTFGGDFRRTFRNVPRNLYNNVRNFSKYGYGLTEKALPSLAGSGAALLTVGNAGSYSDDYIINKAAEKSVDLMKHYTPKPLRGIFNNDYFKYSAKRTVEDAAHSVYDPVRQIAASTLSNDPSEDEDYEDAPEEESDLEWDFSEETRPPGYFQTAYDYARGVVPSVVGGLGITALTAAADRYINH